MHARRIKKRATNKKKNARSTKKVVREIPRRLSPSTEWCSKWNFRRHAFVLMRHDSAGVSRGVELISVHPKMWAVKVHDITSRDETK